MRTAILSDIHGHLAGLRAVLDDIARRDCRRIVCLGDLVDGGDDDAEVARWLRDHGVPCVAGNHDRGAALDLPADVRDFLDRLPETLVEGDALFTHISPRRRKSAIRDPDEAWNALDETAARIVFVGHTHFPRIFRLGGERFTTEPCDFEPGRPVPLDAGERYVVCVGAVGYPRDGIRKPRYAVWDADAGAVEMREVDGPVLPLGS